MKERFKVIAEVHLFLVRNNEILLMIRENTGYMDGYYHVPAGHLDAGEKIEDALIRESKEELGISIDPKDIKLVHVMHKHSERVAFFFEVKKWTGDVTNMEPHKCGGLKWFKLNDLPDKIVPYAKESIKQYLKGTMFSHYEWDKK